VLQLHCPWCVKCSKRFRFFGYGCGLRTSQKTSNAHMLWALWQFVTAKLWTRNELYRSPILWDLITESEWSINLLPDEVLPPKLRNLPFIGKLLMKYYHVRFEVLKAVTMKNVVFWNIKQHDSCKNRVSRGCIASIIRVKGIGELKETTVVTSNRSIYLYHSSAKFQERHCRGKACFTEP
jgi:hypothetical protein